VKLEEIRKGIKMQQADDAKMRTKLKLTAVQRLIEKHRIVVPAPSRRTLINMCEDGRFETASNPPGPLGWLVYEDSFWKWVRSLDGE
jgi:hypothetical protein